MHNEEIPTLGLRGAYRDVMRDQTGRVTWDSGWTKNTIVLGCRNILASFMKGQASTFGIQGLLFGAGDPSWDAGGAPPTSPTDTALVDPNPYLVPSASLALDFLDPNLGTVVQTPTNRIQIVATLGVNQPSWPDANHVDGTLREFGLVGELGGVTSTLINEVRHPAILKDPVNTLVRTIQLVF